MAAVITHSVVSGAAANPDVDVDGVAWDAAHVITGVITPSQGGTGIVNSDSSTLTISGAFGTTFTVSATTSLALPTTGTLATLDGGETLTNKTFVAPVLGTPASGTLTNCTGLPISTGLTGAGTGVLAALAINVGSAGAFVTFNGALGTPSSGTLTNATGLPVSTGISGLASGIATFLATPSSANLRSALTDESGTGVAYFQGGALGTPSSGTLTNATGLPLSGLTTQAAYTIVANNSGSSAVPTAVDIAALTTKASPAAGDYVLLSDQAASGAFKKATVTSLTGASGVSSIAGNTGAFTLGIGLTNATNNIIVDPTYFMDFIGGLTLSKSAATTLGIAAGVAVDSTKASIMKLGSAYTKSFGSNWAVGTGNGGLDTGSTASNTWYHVWLIMRTDTNVVDALMSTSATAPTMPTNYTLKRRIGAVKTDGSGNITAFTQVDNTFTWDVCSSDVSTTNPGTAAVTATLNVPTGVVVEAIYSSTLKNGTSNANILLTSLSQTDTTPSTTAFSYQALGGVAGGSTFGGEFRTATNTSGQIRYRVDASGASDIIKIITRGWRDSRSS